MNISFIHLSSLVSLLGYIAAYFTPIFFLSYKNSKLVLSLAVLSLFSHFASLCLIFSERFILFRDNKSSIILDYLPLPISPLLVSSFILLLVFFYADFFKKNRSPFKSKVIFFIGYLLYLFYSLFIHLSYVSNTSYSNYLDLGPTLGAHIIFSIIAQVLFYIVFSLGLVVFILNKFLLSNKLVNSTDSPALIPSIKILKSFENLSFLFVVCSLITGLTISGAESYQYKVKFLFSMLFLILLFITIFLRTLKKYSPIKITNIATLIWLILLIFQSLSKVYEINNIFSFNMLANIGLFS